MKYWPKWLRTTFFVSGGLFLLAVIFSVYVLSAHKVIPPLSVSHPSGTPGQPSIEPTSLVNIITAVTGLVTAASGLYGQILAGQKQKQDYELAKQQMKAQEKMQEKNAMPRKTNKKRKR